jgi:4-carboxymuconolactone decarboxylase
MDEQERYEAGLELRRAVLGDTYVEQSLANLTPFNAPFQNLITRYAWGEIWDRSGLPRQTRSLITLALLVALNRGDELRMHIRAALRNGVTIEEIQEVFLHCAIYCGVPAANAAFHLAEDVLATDAPDQET